MAAAHPAMQHMPAKFQASSVAESQCQVKSRPSSSLQIYMHLFELHRAFSNLLEQIDGGEADDPSDAVHGGGVERVVDLESEEEAFGREEGEAGDGADEQRAPHREDVAPSAHGHRT